MEEEEEKEEEEKKEEEEEKEEEGTELCHDGRILFFYRGGKAGYWPAG